ncbi:phospholipase A1-like [Coccinella septempunctata]|uniref:phospholipase A1-like n=1 Tax=Coccinella septempunctata TaxID=41139 RepID=UPI001D061CC6|nr:phospholipase A1-like [Coccinella septempunctata]
MRLFFAISQIFMVALGTHPVELNPETDGTEGLTFNPNDVSRTLEVGGESAEIEEQSLFPYLNMSSITMIDDEGRPVIGYFTKPPEGGRSAADLERKMSGIRYILYTRKDPKGVTVKDADELKKTSFDPKKNVKLITHGWLSSGSEKTCIEIKDGYLENWDVNVIIMDWSQITKNWYYVNPMFSVPKVAHHYAILINDIINNMTVDPRNIHLIGHSLGAQVSGLVWKDMEGKKPGRVTGLDPASPGFDRFKLLNDRISNESAHFVDVIHTCGGILGILNPLGHADFYPNGGTAAQPGCTDILKIASCSHGRSWNFFAESVRYPQRIFRATKCDSWEEFITNKCYENEKIIMGEKAPPTARGKYFLMTKPASPFSLFVEE